MFELEGNFYIDEYIKLLMFKFGRFLQINILRNHFISSKATSFNH